jgi:hypothetical protein
MAQLSATFSLETYQNQSAIQKLAITTAQNEKGTLSNNYLKSPCVAGIGLEPMTFGL